MKINKNLLQSTAILTAVLAVNSVTNDVQVSAETDSPGINETSSETLNVVSQEEYEEVEQQVIDAENDLNQRQQNSEEANDEYLQAEEALENKEAEYSRLQSDTQEAEDELTANKEAYNEANADLETITQELDQKIQEEIAENEIENHEEYQSIQQDIIDQQQTIQDSEQVVRDLENKISQNQIKLDSAEAEKNELEQQLADLAQEIEDISNEMNKIVDDSYNTYYAHEQAKIDLNVLKLKEEKLNANIEEIREALNNPENSLDYLNNQLSDLNHRLLNVDSLKEEGAFSFFEWALMEYPEYTEDIQQGLDILKEFEIKGNVNPAIEGDATSYDNLIKTVDYLERNNELRISDQNFPDLQKANTNFTILAQALVAANVSSVGKFEHKGTFPRAENLAIYHLDPFAGWYSRELEVYNYQKSVYDQYLLDNPEADTVEASIYADNAGNEKYGVHNEIGHYLNIVRRSHEITAIGVNSSRGSLHAQQLDGIYGEEILIPEEVYREMIEQFQQSLDPAYLENKIQTLQSEINELENSNINLNELTLNQQLRDLESSANDVAQEIEKLQEEMEELERLAETYIPDFEAKGRYRESLTIKQEEQTAQLETVKAKVNEFQNEYDQNTSEKTDAETDLNQMLNTLEELQNKLDGKRAEIIEQIKADKYADLLEELEEKREIVDQLRAVMETSQENFDQLSQQLLEAENDVQEANNRLDEALELKTKANEDYQEALAKYQELKDYFDSLAISAVVINPAPTKPEVKDPEVKDPEVKDPEVKDPEVKDPEVKDPEVKEPEVKDPEVKDPEVKDPEVKDPEVKDPEVKDPEVKVPTVKAPSVKEPEAKSTGAKAPSVKRPVTNNTEVKGSETKNPRDNNKDSENQESRISTASALPETGEVSNYAIFNTAVMSILLGLGLVEFGRKEYE